MCDRSLHVAVLGPVEVRRGDEPIALMPALRALLAALALDAPRVASISTLRSRLWEDEREEGSLTTLHSYVSRLRRRLGPEVLLTQSPGYRLDLRGGDTDVEQFTTLLCEARAESDPKRSRLLVSRSIDLWRGEAFADVPQQFARAEAARLGEQLLEARELAAELDLALGRHREVVEELTPLLALDPLRETMRAHLMVAHYRSGRQAQALDVYEQGCRDLADQLGLDPSPALRRLHERILRHDPALDAPSEGPLATTGPAESANAAPGVVAPPTSMIGRDEHLADVADLLLGGARLVTLTGAGGVGKTRLALAVADRVRDAFPDGVASVSLSTVDEPKLVLSAVDYALGRMLAEGGKGEHTSDPRSDLTARLRGRRVLLVLDNVEHLLSAATDVGWLVGACPGLTVLATSRAPLRVAGEHEWLVEPLSLPTSGGVGGGRTAAQWAASVARTPAVALFVARARSVGRGFVLDEHNASAVVEICRRLGGIPLAIELAAARIRLFAPDALLGRLDESLAGGPRDLPERQRTMQSALDWSYELLDEPAQRLFRRLAVFSGGWTLDLLEAIEGPGALDPLEDLVEHSLVSVRWSTQGRPRYVMLEPIRQHARRLAESADTDRDDVVRRHARAYLDLAERATTGYLAREQVHWLAVMDDEHANVLTAFDRSVRDGEHDTAARIAWALWAYWFFRGHSAVGRRTASIAVTLAHAEPGPRCRAYVGLAAMSWAQGDREAAGAEWKVALELGERVDDAEAQGNSHAGLGIVALSAGDFVTAEHHHRRAIALAETLGPDTYGPWILALNHVWLGTALLQQGRTDDAVGHFEHGRRIAEARGDRLATFVALWNLARVARDVDPDAAHRHLLDGIRLSLEVGYLSNLPHFLDALVVVELRRSRSGTADLPRLARLLGAAEGYRDLTGGPGFGSYYLPDEEARDAAVAAIAEGLGDVTFGQQREAGRSSDLDEVLDSAGS